MKRNPLFEKCLAEVSPEVREEVRLNMDIANRIYDILKSKNMTQREFAALMCKRESEISRWLSGTHGFTTATLAKISAVLEESIVEVKRNVEPRYVFVQFDNIVSTTDVLDDSYTNNVDSYCEMAYLN